MIYNRPRVGKKKRLRWYFNSKIPISRATTYSGVFTCNRVTYTSIILASGFNASMRYGNTTVYASAAGGWISENYRTIIFTEEPTGGLLAFLEVNATPQ